MENRELENYLSRLERALGPIAISEKAEIITEIKSHVLDASNDETKSINDILKSLGEPEQVANKYLIERGLGPQKPPKHPIVKWLVIGFLGTIALIIVFIFLIISQFTPFIKVDEEKGRVQILGGLIDVNEKEGRVKVGKQIVDNDNKISFEGSLSINENGNDSSFKGVQNLEKLERKVISFGFINAKKVEFEQHQDNTISYDCKLKNNSDIIKLGGALFDFAKSGMKKCYFKIPKDYKLVVNAVNGKIRFDQLKNDLDLEMVNGKINFTPAEDAKYRYDIEAVNGNIDEFVNSNDKNAYKINMSLVNGKISN